MKLSDYWSRIPALSVEALLVELHVARLRSFSEEGAPLPTVTIMTKSGHSTEGRVLSYDSAGRTLVLEESSQSPVAADFCYLPLSEVAAVRIHGALDYVDCLTNGSVELGPRSDVPTQLQLKRDAEAVAARVSDRIGERVELSCDWTHFEVDPDRRHSVHVLVTAFEVALSDLLAEFGVSAIAGRVDGVAIEAADSAGLSVRGKTIVLRANFSAGRSGRLTAAQMRVKLEKAF